MEQITPTQAKEKLTNNTSILLIDARIKEEFGISQISQAINIPVDSFEEHLSIFGDNETIMVYCNTGIDSAIFVEKGKQHGINIIDIAGGMNAWVEKGHDILKKKNIIPLMRQVLIAAGGLVLLGIILQNLLSSSFIIISIFVGAGLMFAGISGICGMTKILALMPWNRVTTYQ